LLISGGKSSRILVFSEDLFFIYLLPPIIFNAGFQVKKKQFFRNFMTIMLFGAIGTLISFVIISFGAKHLFEKMNIGDLTIADYLGTLKQRKPFSSSYSLSLILFKSVLMILQPLEQYSLLQTLFAPCKCLIKTRHLSCTVLSLEKV
jgi:hypothetical protein